MSTTVTIRPRRLRTPAISLDDSGTRVSRSGMNTSCTREIGSPNTWPPSIAGTYSATALSALLTTGLVSWDIFGSPSQFSGLFLQRRDQSGAIELANVIVEAGQPAA